MRQGKLTLIKEIAPGDSWTQDRVGQCAAYYLISICALCIQEESSKVPSSSRARIELNHYPITIFSDFSGLHHRSCNIELVTSKEGSQNKMLFSLFCGPKLPTNVWNLFFTYKVYGLQWSVIFTIKKSRKNNNYISTGCLIFNVGPKRWIWRRRKKLFITFPLRSSEMLDFFGGWHSWDFL